MHRKTDSNNPTDWLYLAESDLEGIRDLAARELAYHLCRSKLAEVLEKVFKAELIHAGWFLEKTHDLMPMHHPLFMRISHRFEHLLENLGHLALLDAPVTVCRVVAQRDAVLPRSADILSNAARI